MFTGIIGDLVSDIFRKAVRTILTLTFVGICVLGAGFATGMIHPSDLRPENVARAISACKDRVEMMKDFAGELSKVDYAGIVRDRTERISALEELGETASPYTDVPLARLQKSIEDAKDDVTGADDAQPETDGEGEVVQAGLF